MTTHRWRRRPGRAAPGVGGTGGYRRTGAGLTTRELGAYLAAQFVGAVGGTALAHAMFDLPALAVSSHRRTGAGLWLGEIVATTGLLLLIGALSHARRNAVAPAAVGAWIGAAYWFTSSTSFANPAVTVGRAFTDTFAGIAPGSVPGFVAAQVAGMLLAVGAITWWYVPADRTAETAVETTPAQPERTAA